MTQQIRPLPPELTAALVGLGGRKLVLVEGDDDADAFNRWFLRNLPDLEFYPAGGSAQMDRLLNQLALERPDVKAFGIQDRDYRDDAEVQALLADPNSRRFLLSRYELENYLLEPEAIQQELKVYYARRHPTPAIEEVERELLQICVHICPLMAANWVLYEAGLEFFAESFPKNNRALVIQETAKKLGCTEDEAEQNIFSKERVIYPYLARLATAHTKIKGKVMLFWVFATFIGPMRGLPKDSFKSYLVRAAQQHGLHPDITTLVTRILAA